MNGEEYAQEPCLSRLFAAPDAPVETRAVSGSAFPLTGFHGIFTIPFSRGREGPDAREEILAKPGKQGKRFETRLVELEEIIARLESGETPLEESLVLFEKGSGILRELTGILEEAERKVEILTRDVSGELAVQPFEGEEDE